MMNVFLSLLIASFVGTMIWIVQSSIRPLTQKVFSQTWHYYTGLIPVFFLLGGTELMNRMIPLVWSALPNTNTNTNSASGSVVEQSALVFPMEHTTASSSSFMKPLFDSLLQFKHIKELVFIAMIIWIAGIIVFLTVNVKNYWSFKRLILQNSRAFHIAQDAVKVIVSPHASTPMVMGFLKPMVVLPDARFGEKELAMILSHELMHLKRHDLLVKLAVLIANAIHWFNPLIHSLNKQINIYCELSCDEKVVQEMDTESRRFYGETLLSILEYGVIRRTVMGTSSFYHPKEDMKRRLGNLMSVKKTKKSMVLLSLVASITLVASGGAAAYAAGSVSKIPTGEQVEGRNIYVQSPDGTVLHYDKEGKVTDVTKTHSKKQKQFDAKTQKKIDELHEKIRGYIEKGLPVPQKVTEAFTPEEIGAALIGISAYVYDENGIRPMFLDNN